MRHIQGAKIEPASTLPVLERVARVLLPRDQVTKLDTVNRRLREKLAVDEALAAERLRILDSLTAGAAKGRR